MIEHKERIAPRSEVKNRTHTDVTETYTAGTGYSGLAGLKRVQMPQIEVQHFQRAPLHRGRYAL